MKFKNITINWYSELQAVHDKQASCLHTPSCIVKMLMDTLVLSQFYMTFSRNCCCILVAVQLQSCSLGDLQITEIRSSFGCSP